MIRLLIADDHEVIRESLKNILHATEFEVAAEANNAWRLAADLAIEHHVDIALLDITMPEGGGLAALAKIKAVRPETAVVMYSVHDAPRYIQRTRELANGYLVKGASRKTLLQTLHDVHAGHSVWPPSNYGTDGSYT